MSMLMEASPRAFAKRATPAASVSLAAWTVFAVILVVAAIFAAAASPPPVVDPAAMALIAP